MEDKYSRAWTLLIIMFAYGLFFTFSIIGMFSVFGLLFSIVIIPFLFVYYGLLFSVYLHFYKTKNNGRPNNKR